MPSKYRLIGFSETESEIKEAASINEVEDFLNKHRVVWLDCVGLNQSEAEEVANKFSFHKLTVEAYFHTPQRSKVEDYATYFYAIIKEVEYKKEVRGRKIALYVGKNYLVTLREQESHNIDFVIKRIKEKNQKILSSGPDYLCYLIVDGVVDDYMPILDYIETEVDVIEKEILANATPETLKKIFKLKKDILLFRKIVWPMREVLLKFERDDLPYMTDKTRVYMRDVYDHIITITDIIETYRELASGVVEAYLTTLSNNINQVVKVLTVLASLAVPATVIASFYGMNLEPFPEKEIFGDHSYYFALFLIASSTALMMLFFKKKNWI